MLFYDAMTGQVDTGQLDVNGDYHPLTSLPAGTFHVGWTHIVSSIGSNNLLFYEKTTGQVDTGQLDDSGNYHSLTSLPPGTFHVSWTHIVSDLTLG